MKPLNKVITAIPASGIRQFFEIAATMSDVISLGVGEPDFVTPWRTREAGIAALEKGYTGYTANAGLLELRAAICGDLRARFAVDYDPVTQCLVTAGVSQAVDIVMRVLLDPGDEVIVAEPCYVAYGACIAMAGGTAVYVESEAADGFRVHPDRVRAAISDRTKAILLCSPANPTGAVQNRQDLAAVADIAREHDLYLVSDEIYERLTHVGEHVCVAGLEGAWERTVLLGGFSKAHAMTGWRVGYICAPPAVLELVTRVHQYAMICAPHPAQVAALEALCGGEDDVAAMVADYDRRRRLFVKGLNEAGLPCPEPAGAFYAFPSTRETGLEGTSFAERLLKEYQVAVVPGGVFGPSGRWHVRCSYATAQPLLEEAIDRIGRFVRTLRPSG